MMDFSKLERLPQVKIDKPCPENWDAMEGNEQKRFCAGCGCHVYNIAEMNSTEAEKLLSQPGRVCTRLTVDNRNSVLTRDGWIPRMLLAGAVAATVAGCSSQEATVANTGTTTPSVSTTSTTPSTFEIIEEKVLELIDEIKEAISPGSTKHYIVMGDMAVVPRTSTSSYGPKK